MTEKTKSIRPLPARSVISYKGTTAEVIEDSGDDTVTVLVDGVVQDWLWKFDGVDCKIISIPERVATPGPWRAVSPYIATAKNTVVARVMAPGDEDSPTQWQCKSVADLENLANLDLLAAAPRLAETVKSLMAMVSKNDNAEDSEDVYGVNFTDDEIERRLRNAKVVLAEAGL